MAFIIPKDLAHRVAQSIATGCGEDMESQSVAAPVMATAEAVLAKMQAEAAEADKQFKATPAGMRKAAVALFAGKARLLALTLADRASEGTPQTEQARKGGKMRGAVPQEVANQLRQALIANGQDPRDFRPEDGKPTKSAPAAVVTLNLLVGVWALSARPAQPKALAAKG